MNKKMIIVFLCLTLCLFISISTVSSAENTDGGNDLNKSDTLKHTEDDLQSYSIGSFSDLNARIASTPEGSTLVLDRDFSYIVNNIYEVKPINLTPVYSYNSKSTELTLITCNNLNKYRIIVKAKLNKNAN